MASTSVGSAIIPGADKEEGSMSSVRICGTHEVVNPSEESYYEERELMRQNTSGTRRGIVS